MHSSVQAEPAQFIREIEAKYGRPIGILVDIQGPKHRVGMFPNPDAGTKVELKKGQMYTFDLNKDAEGDDERVVSATSEYAPKMYPCWGIP